MTKYDYLRLPKSLRLQIEHAENRIQVLKDKSQGVKSANSSPIVTSSPNPFRSQDDICDYVLLEEKVREKKKKLKDVTTNIQQAINEMSVGRVQEVLECRFIDGWTVEMIRECYGYADCCAVYRVIRQGIEKIPLNPNCYC